MSAAVQFLVGTASWTDPSLIHSDVFYPPSVRTAEERLRFYAQQFKTVEVDSTYYGLPAERSAKLWAERTPEGFVFNIKAFALMTQHPAEISRLPRDLREMLPAEQRKERRLTRPSREVVDTAFQMFWSALAPLRATGKLGMIAFQFPPYFVAKPPNFDYLASLPERLPGAAVAIEFRHPSWVRDRVERAETMSFLRVHGLFYTSIDAPEDKSIVPSFIEATGDQVYLRFHGRNRANWFKHNITAAERYRYLYSERELQSLAHGLEKLGERGVRRAYAVFNNCYQNFGIMNAATMAEILRRGEPRA
ncbi:MAG: DUF72 domain-containing protein [Candidatus Binataceae bacterium]